jgi:hypothetical protein
MVLIAKFVVLVLYILLARVFWQPEDLVVVQVDVKFVRGALALIAAPKRAARQLNKSQRDWLSGCVVEPQGQRTEH